jgi:acyl carrier protein
MDKNEYKNELTANICDKIAKQLRKSADVVTPDKRMKEDLTADSLDIVELMMGLEDEYKVKIPDDILPTLKTIGDIADYIYEQTNNTAK